MTRKKEFILNFFMQYNMFITKELRLFDVITNLLNDQERRYIKGSKKTFIHTYSTVH